ncbi:MAG: glycosyltransferase [Proteobacteria bacterium]|nr:glycosyltransferase [Pseudomonadota bacterium]
MKILHVISGLTQGGAETVLYRLIKASHTEMDHVVVSLTNIAYYGPRLRTLGVEVKTLEMSSGRFTLFDLLKLYRIIRAISPDVVQTWMYHADLLGGIAARLAGVRVVCWGIRSSNLDAKKSSFSSRIVARICAIISNYVPNSIICCSEQAAQWHQSIGYQKSKFTIIPNGYDIAQFSPSKEKAASLRAEWHINPNELLLGMVARWDPQKDHANFLSAVALIISRQPQLRCVLVGHNIDQYNTELKTLIESYQLQDRVLLAGSHDDIPAVMNALDLHVSSSAYGEAFPNVVAEAMACGTPCVVTKVGDAPLIVGETGCVVIPNNPSALAQAIEQMLLAIESPQGGEMMQACRNRIVEHFNINRMVTLYRNIWSKYVL